MNKNLNDFNSIDLWKELSNEIKKLSINELSKEEFLFNLKKLNNLLFKKDIELDLNMKKNEDQIEIIDLLYAIYNINEPNTLKNEKFCENIFQLSDLGIKNIKFQPYNFVDQSQNLYKYIGKDIYINKAYTDGTFDLEIYNLNFEYFRLTNIKHATYLLDFLLKNSKFDKNSIIENGTAILKDFNGVYPSIDEVKVMEFPKLIVPSQTINWGKYPVGLKEEFDLFNDNNVSYQKKIKL